MPVYKLFKNGELDNTIIASEVDSIADQYDSIEEVVLEVGEPPAPDPKDTIEISDIRPHLTLAEKTIWDNNSEPEIVTAKKEFVKPLNKADATEVLDFLVQANIFSQGSVDGILSLIEV